MPFAEVILVPGVDVEKTSTLNKASYSFTQYGRWKEGLFQKIGGWTKFYPFNLGGIPRALHAWQDLNDVDRLAVGTTTELDVIANGSLTRITPQQKITNFAPNFSTTNGQVTVDVVDSNITDVTTLDTVFFNTPITVGGIIVAGSYTITTILGTHSYRITTSTTATSTVTNGGAVPSFTTTNGSSSVSVTLAAHGLSAGGTINFPIATTVGGITIQGTYTAVTITSASVFTIATSTSATSGTTASMNSGNAEILYTIAIGPQSAGLGYGTGGYGSGGWGTGVVPGQQTGTPITATDWTLDNWGEILLACPTGGAIYAWQPLGGVQNAQAIGTAPAFNTGIFVSNPYQILVAYGSTVTQNIGSDQDPLTIKWSDQGDYTDWTPSLTNQAGSYRIPTGSKIVGALQGPKNALIWTDLDVWSMQYIGFPLVFGFNKIGASCGLIGQHARATLGGIVYWMGKSNFFALTGNGAAPIPCPVWDQVYQDLDTDNMDKCVAAANTVFNEIWWFYPSASGGTGENDSYVKLNVAEGSWDIGPMGRSAWIDQSVLGNPIGTTSTGLVYRHEDGYDADGQPINAVMQTGYWAINAGSEMVFVDWFQPNMRYGLINGNQNANLMITFYSQMFSGGPVRTYGPYNFDSTKTFINTRIRGQQMAMRIESNDVGSFWRLGLNRYRFAPDGRY
jgi:hypothetical protein